MSATLVSLVSLQQRVDLFTEGLQSGQTVLTEAVGNEWDIWGVDSENHMTTRGNDGRQRQGAVCKGVYTC